MASPRDRPLDGPDAPAWAKPETRRAMFRGGWLSLGVVVVGLGLLAAFLIGVETVDSTNQRLRDSGVAAEGTIISLEPDLKYQSGSAQVAYDVEDEPRKARVDLGANVSNYHRGQHVSVFYDADEPGLMTIAGEDNQSEGSVWLMVAALVVGVFVLGFGLVAVQNWLICRRVLRRHPWVHREASVHLDDKKRVVALVESPTGEPVLLRSVPTRWFTPVGGAAAPLQWPSGPIWVAGLGWRGSRLAISTTGGGRPVLARRRPG